jgi:hypothetical protein
MSPTAIAPHRIQRLAELLSAVDGDACTWLTEFLLALLQAEQANPNWATDAVLASALLTKENGELTNACLNFHFSRWPDEEWRRLMREQAVHCGARTLRFLLRSDAYKPMTREDMS